MSTLDEYTQDTSQTSPSTKMPKRLNQKNFPNLNSYVQASLASLLALPENEKDLMIQEAHYFLKSLKLLKKENHLISFLRTSRDYFLTMRAKHSVQSSEPLMKSGMMLNGKLLTLNISFHKVGNESSLLDILEKDVPKKYFLSEKYVSYLKKYVPPATFQALQQQTAKAQANSESQT